MKFEQLEHRSDAWYLRRLGLPTASQFHRITTPAGRPSAQAPLYEAELIGERIFKRPLGKDVSNIPAVRYGIETEAEAAQMLENILGIKLEPGGFMMDDRGRYGASPDRLLVSGNRREITEIKCPEIPRHIANLLFGPDDAYKVQLQGQLLVSGFDVVHFFSYRSDCPPLHMKIERDDRLINSMKSILEEFCDNLEADYKRALNIGAWST